MNCQNIAIYLLILVVTMVMVRLMFKCIIKEEVEGMVDIPVQDLESIKTIATIMKEADAKLTNLTVTNDLTVESKLIINNKSKDKKSNITIDENGVININGPVKINGDLSVTSDISLPTAGKKIKLGDTMQIFNDNSGGLIFKPDEKNFMYIKNNGEFNHNGKFSVDKDGRTYIDKTLNVGSMFYVNKEWSDVVQIMLPEMASGKGKFYFDKWGSFGVINDNKPNPTYQLRSYEGKDGMAQAGFWFWNASGDDNNWNGSNEEKRK